MSQTIHFCWIGQHLQWVHGFAMISAAQNGGLAHVVLHHTDDLADSPVVRALQTSGVLLSRIKPQDLLKEVGAEIGLDDRLIALYEKISSPVIKSDILRAAILYRDGGIYLDVDTITLAPLQSLLHNQQFIGLEYIVWPHWVKTSHSPISWSRALALDVIRKTLRVTPNGWMIFRAFEIFYFKAVNNAIIGGMPKSPFFKTYLKNMFDVPDTLQTQTYALGPDLLQTMIRQQKFDDLMIYEPSVFYPLPPEISQHWFRPCKNANILLDKALRPQTLVAHWYASVRSKNYVKQITPDFVIKHCNTQLYSAMVCKNLNNIHKFCK